MRVFRVLGWDAVAWSLRRLHCPVGKSALVLEVGSGGNPYFRANVLCDAYEKSRQRHWAKLVNDRPTVLGFAEALPFKDKRFDFVIASHVMEHSADPAQFLEELTRVAKAGYIEVPDALMERLNPYLDHRLEITVRDSRLVIRKKVAWREDVELSELYDRGAGRIIAGETIPRHPFEFHVRHYWHQTIDYVIVNPEADASWEAPESPATTRKQSMRQILSGAVLAFLRLALSQRERNRNIDLVSLLRCPACHGDLASASEAIIVCADCGHEYPVRRGMPCFIE